MKTTLWRVMLLCQVIGLAGCATTPEQQEYRTTLAAFRDATAQGKQCYSQLASNPTYAPLALHIPLSPSPPSLQQQADAALPSSAEIALLLDWYKGVQNCRQKLLTRSQQSFAFLAPVFQQNFNAADAIYVQLVRQQVSYGEANRELAQVRGENQARVLAAGKAWQTDLQQRSEIDAIGGPPYAGVPGPMPFAGPGCSETGSCYGDMSDISGLPKTTYVPGYFRSDGTHVGSYYRSD
jgi:hypothetical protein